MTPSREISVVIPTYQRRALLERTLHFLAHQTYPPDAFEVVVSIDGSEDGTEEMVRRTRAPYRLICLWQENRGRAAACNAGLHRAQGDLIVLLDDDMEPAPTFLEAHARAHEGRTHEGKERLGVLGAVPVPIEPDASPVTRYIGTKFNRHLATLSRPDYQLKLRDFYSGNFSIKRSVLLEVGGFDEEFDVYGNEDLDLSLRLQHAGVAFAYCREAAAWQRYTKDFAALSRDTVAKGRTAVLLARKHPGSFDDLKLGTYGHAPWVVRQIREALLRLGERQPAFPEAIIRFVMWLERFPVFSTEAAYVQVLGYFYWMGARAALREHQDAGSGLDVLKDLSRGVQA